MSARLGRRGSFRGGGTWAWWCWRYLAFQAAEGVGWVSCKISCVGHLHTLYYYNLKAFRPQFLGCLHVTARRFSARPNRAPAPFETQLSSFKLHPKPKRAVPDPDPPRWVYHPAEPASMGFREKVAPLIGAGKVPPATTGSDRMAEEPLTNRDPLPQPPGGKKLRAQPQTQPRCGGRTYRVPFWSMSVITLIVYFRSYIRVSW